MTMSNKGLTKLMEECGELVQIAAKKVAYPDTDQHPDGTISMKFRLEEEVGDVLAAIEFIIVKFDLSNDHIARRTMMKLTKYNAWDKDSNI